MLIGVVVASPAAAATQYQLLGKIVDSSFYGHKYAYGPAIIRVGGVPYVYYCGLGTPHGWDSVRYAPLNQSGGLTAAPQVILRTSGGESESAVCDPSIVRWQAPGDAQPYFYLFYTGHVSSVGSAVFVARSSTLEGPFRKWTTNETWAENPPNPSPVVLPSVPQPSQFYGAGQQTVVVDPSGQELVMWYQDDTTCGAAPCRRILKRTSADPTLWNSAPVQAYVPQLGGAESADVKYDQAAGGYVMFSIGDEHGVNSYLQRRSSPNGIDWSQPEGLCVSACFPNWTHNVGAEGGPGGTLLASTLIAYGAPYDLSPLYNNNCVLAPLNCWGYWDLYASRLTYSP